MSDEKTKTRTSRDKLQRLTQLFLLEQSARKKTDVLELGHFIANSTYKLFPYNRCLFWLCDGKNVNIANASGVSKIEKNTGFYKSYVRFLKQVVQDNEFSSDEWAKAISIDISDFSKKHNIDIQKHVQDNLVIYAFSDPDAQCFGGVSIENEEVISQSDQAVIQHICEAYAHSLYGLYMQARGKRNYSMVRFFFRRKLFLALALILSLFFFPIRASVTVPAEVVPQDPFVVSASIEGVVDDILVKPNQYVEEGDLLVKLNDTRYRSDLEVAKRERFVLRADLEQSSRLAFTDSKRKQEIALIRGKINKKDVEIEHLKEMLDKTNIRALQGGVALFTDTNEIRGQPFRTGQRIMLLAEPKKVRLQLRIPADAMIKIDREEYSRLFLNENPLDAHSIFIEYIEYEPTEDPDGLLTYKVYAVAETYSSDFKIGARGTSKIYGYYTILGYQLLRRPLISLRQFLML